MRVAIRSFLFFGFQVLLGTFIAILLVEVTLRLTRPHYSLESIKENSLQYHASIFARHVFPKQLQTAAGWGEGNTYPINTLGYRGEAFSIEKMPGEIRIVILGGSSVFDPVASDYQDWPHLVQLNLANAGYGNVEVINAGIPGHATFDAVGRLYSEIWLYEPDFVILDECWNDIKYFTELSPTHSLLRNYSPYNPTIDPRQNCLNAVDCLLANSQLYLRLRSRYLNWKLNIGPEGAIDNQPLQSSFGEVGPEQYKLNLELFVDTALNIGAMPILFTQPRLVVSSNSQEDETRVRNEYVHLTQDALRNAFAACDQAVMEVAREKHSDLFDLSANFSGQSDLFYDHVHLSQKGSKLVAQAVAKYLEGFLAK